MTFPFLSVVASWNAYAASRRPAPRAPPLQMRHLRPLPWGPYPPRRLRSPRVTSVPCGICLPSVLPRWCRSACEGGATALHNVEREGGRQKQRVRPHHWTQAAGSARGRRSQSVRALAILADRRPATRAPCSVEEPVQHLSGSGRYYAGGSRPGRRPGLLSQRDTGVPCNRP